MVVWETMADYNVFFYIKPVFSVLQGLDICSIYTKSNNNKISMLNWLFLSRWLCCCSEKTILKTFSIFRFSGQKSETRQSMFFLFIWSRKYKPFWYRDPLNYSQAREHEERLQTFDDKSELKKTRVIQGSDTTSWEVRSTPTACHTCPCCCWCCWC